MLTLTRTVRFCISPAMAPEPRAHNGYAGSPSMNGLGRYYELRVTCSGTPDPASGYLVNIKDIDAAVRADAIPIISAACRESPDAGPLTVLSAIAAALAHRLTGIFHSVRWNLTPYYSLEMNDTSTHALLRQSFDFSAAHRLHCDSLTDAENRETFGPCNNPSGHGHNYRLEPCVSVSLDPGATFRLADLEDLVSTHIIRPFDHKHLNLDTPEFAPGAANPTVENIARVLFERLREPVAERSRRSAELKSVTVWETDRTSATYPG